MTAHQPSKRQWIKGAAATVGTLAVAPQLWAQGSSAAPVRIGYAIARTGPWAAGAQVSQGPQLPAVGRAGERGGRPEREGHQAPH